MTPMSTEDHGASLDPLSAVDRELVSAPAGWRYSLVVASHTKRALMTLEMSAAERLDLLEHMSRLPGGGVSEEAIAHVLPACETAARMIHEADGNLDVLGDFTVFREFAALNPSLIAALRICRNGAGGMSQ